MGGFPKIPDAKEIAAMTEQAMTSMAADIKRIADYLERLVQLQEQTLHAVEQMPRMRRIAG